MSKHFYLTTPLYSAGGVPHVGHAYTTVIADTIARYKRMCGLEVLSLAGTEEHGLRIELAAQEQGMTPEELADRHAELFKEAWKRLGLQFDDFIRSKETRHTRGVQELFQRLMHNRFVYLGEHSGYYCTDCEAYSPEDRQDCPDCGGPTNPRKEESYLFRLSTLQEKLLGFYQDNPDFVIPSTRMGEIVSLVKGGLTDLPISRTSLRWGIPVPENDKHVFDVWLDALTGYLSAVGYGDHPDLFQKHWPADVQLIGRGILRFHAVYLPALLMAAGLEPPRHILVNGRWSFEGDGSSTESGNAMTVDELASGLPPDYIKYYLLREIPLGADGGFSHKNLLSRVNSDLANDLGNLASRTLKMIGSYFHGVIPEHAEIEGGDRELIRFSRETIQLYRENFDRLNIAKALDSVRELVSVANKYVVANEPWVLAKDFSRRERLATSLYCAAETVRIIAILLGPVVPEGSERILTQLGVDQPLDAHRISTLNWGALKSGSRLGKVEPVYPRLEPRQFFFRLEHQVAGTPVSEMQTGPGQPNDPRISIEDFAKIDMRVGRVDAAERVASSEKLLKLQVDIGSEVRQIVAGIGKEYTPESLVGRQVVVVTNLKPVKLMGVESNGMIVAASDEKGRPTLVGFSEQVEVGARLK
jgi:methionyl-tRNA synthetase